MPLTRTRIMPLAMLAAAVVLLLNASIASAHEHREVGEYTLVVGFSAEPALVDEPNGLSLTVHQGGEDGTPVEGLVDTLQAEIIYGGETMQLELRSRFGESGAYTADVIPTETGTYSFRIFGAIEGNEIDETFTGGPNTFAEVESKDSISFPAGAERDAAAGDDDNSNTLAIAGIVLGSLGLLAGIAGVMMGMNARNAQTRRAGVAAGEVGE